jgi:potassium efflux system protein
MPRSHHIISTLVLFLFVIGSPQTVLAESIELTAALVEARMKALRTSGASDDNKTLKIYDTALTWLESAASFGTDTKTYLDSLTSSPKREAEIQARIDQGETTESELADASRLTHDELAKQLATSRAELHDATGSLAAIENKLAARETYADQIRTRVAQIAERGSKLIDAGTLVEQNATPSEAEASQWIKIAEQIALTAERKAQEARLASQPVRYRAMRAEAAELTLHIQVLNEKVRILKTLSRSSESRIAKPTELGIGADAPSYPLAGRLTSENEQFRETRLAIEASLGEIGAKLGRIEQATRILNDRFATARRLVEFAPDSEALGRILVAYWDELKSLGLSVTRDRLSRQVSDTVISRINHEKALGKLVDARSYIGNQLSIAGLDIDNAAPSSVDVLIKLAKAQRELMRQIIAVESDHIEALTKLDTSGTSLSELLKQYEAYLSARILWIPSHPRLWLAEFQAIPAEGRALLQAVTSLRLSPSLLAILAFAAAAALYLLRMPLWKVQIGQNTQIRKPRDDSIRFTVVALFMTALRSAPLPIGFIAAGGLDWQGESTFITAASETFVGLGVALYALLLFRVLTEDNGLAETHFRWRPELCERFHHEMSWLIRWWLSIAGIAAFLYLMGEEAELLGRIALLVTVAILGSHLFQHIRRDLGAGGKPQLKSNENRLRLCLIAFVLLISIGEIFGLRYSVSIVVGRLLVTLYVGIGLLIAHNVLMRWMRVARRRLDLAKRVAVQAERATDEAVMIEENEIDLVDVGAETTQLLSATTAIATIVALMYIWLPLLPVVDAADQVVLWTSSAIVDGAPVTTKITLETLIVVIFLVAITFYAVRKLPALVELVLRSRTTITPSARYTVSTILGYVIVGAGIVTGLSRLGLQWSQLQWLVAALGVGIGFGLQEIIANFISGLIILFERPIRVGDTVTVGDSSGTVTKIRIRATTIKDFDGKELLVPNKQFITGQLLNWTLSDKAMRLVIPVGVAYGSDVEQALDILKSIAKDNLHVLNDPQPSVIFSHFGDNALDLAVRIFIGSLDDWRSVMTDIRREIYKRFSEAGIVIAFPQRDVHIDADKPIRIAIDPPPAT